MPETGKNIFTMKQEDWKKQWMPGEKQFILMISLEDL